MTCAVTIDLIRHDREVDRQEARDRAIEARAAELLLAGENCYPLEPLSAALALEAIAEAVSGPVFRHLQKAKEADASNHPDAFEAHAVAFTRGLVSLLYGYWGDKAEEQARRDIR